MRSAMKTLLAVAMLASYGCSDDPTGPQGPIWLGFEDAVSHTGRANQSALAVADVNQDGRADVITLDTSNMLGARIFTGTANGGFSALGSVFLYDAQELYVADVSRDGTTDILGVGPSGLYVARGGPHGPGVAFEYPLQAPASTFAVGDLDEDNINDVSVILNGVNAQLGLQMLAPRAADGLLETQLDYQSTMVAAGARSCVRDVTGEGSPDVVIATTTATAPVLVLPNTGGVAFEIPVPVGAGVLTPDAAVRLGCADFDGDGRSDVALLRPGTAATLTILRGTAQAVVISGQVAIGSGTDIAVADVDRDGWMDLLLASPDDGAVLLVRNLGGGSFAEPAAILANSDPTFITVADLDGDSYPDIVTLSLAGTLAVIRNAGR